MLSVIAILVIISASTAFAVKPAFLFATSSPQPTSTQTTNPGSSLNTNTTPDTAANPTPDATGTASADASATAIASPTAAATSTTNYHSGQLIYQVTDWTTWQGSAQWKIVDANTYGSDGTDDGSSGRQYTTWAPGLNLPQNYAIEATITFVRSTENHGDYEVDLMGRGDGTSNGYGVGAYAFSCSSTSSTCDNEAAISLIGIGNDSSNGTNTTRLTTSRYTLDNKPHTFRAEFQKDTIKFSIDGAPYGSTTDNTYLDAGRIGLRVYDADVNVTSFKVLAL